jgi:hypothetical protein
LHIEWIGLAQGMDRCRAVVNGAIYLRFLWRQGISWLLKYISSLVIPSAGHLTLRVLGMLCTNYTHTCTIVIIIIMSEIIFVQNFWHFQTDDWSEEYYDLWLASLRTRILSHLAFSIAWP